MSYAAFLEPGDAFYNFGRLLPIQTMPEHVQRAIAGYEVDPVSLVTKIKFVDKLSAIMNYSKLAGDIPREKSLLPPPSQSCSDFSKLSDDEWKEFLRLRSKAMRVDTE